MKAVLLGAVLAAFTFAFGQTNTAPASVPRCQKCQGRGVFACPTCQGGGGIHCTVCNGTGAGPDETTIRECRACKGKGKFIQTYTIATSPGGLGRHNRAYTGERYRACTKCNGTGKEKYTTMGYCTNCVGRKLVICPTCRGLKLIRCQH